LNSRSLILFATFVLIAACNNHKRSGAADITIVADSAKDANKIYTGKLTDLSQTRDMAALLCQGWELEDDLDAISSSNEAMGILPFRSYYLSPDSSFVKNPRNVIEYGRWLYDPGQKTVTLRYSNGGKDIYKIAALAPDELVLVSTGIESITKLKFVSAGKRYRDMADDPYHISNNGWRIRPKKPESDEQIRQRLELFAFSYPLLQG